MMSGLVSTEWLESNLGQPGVVVLEVSFYEPATAAWFRGHIPGSQYVWWKDFCWDDDERQFPSAEVMAARLGAIGVDDDSTLVLVGDPIQFATYAYWVLAMSGFEHLTVLLDGGHATWEAEGRALSDAPTSVARLDGPTSKATVSDARLGRDDVLAGLKDSSRALIDVRSSEEYNGERVSPLTAPFDHGAERKGHIPGAVHLPYEHLLDSDGTFLEPVSLVEAFERAGVGSEQEIVTYCRLSHRASLAWFALTRIADRPNVRVYDGSWTEWGSMVGMPIEK
jgi:thiosulfate/3-mercaptopyruvate sulfurtransferase